MKRELAFALEVQPEMAGSLGRTRASRADALSSVQTSSPVEVSENVNGESLNCPLRDDCLIVYTRRKKPRFGYFDEFTEEAVRKDSACSDVDRDSDSIEPNCNVGVEECEIDEDAFEEKPIYNLDQSIDKEDPSGKLEPSLIDEGDVQWTQVVIEEEINYMNMSTEYNVEVEVIENGLSLPEFAKRESSLGVNMETGGEGSGLTATKKNLELKMSKKILLNKKPTTVKELFETGLLEGVPVVYMGGRKAFGLRGTITDVGILCSCSLCKGRNIIPPSQFEIHACKSYKRAAQYICFENGKSLLEVLKICRGTPLHMLETAVQKALNSLPTEETLACKRCKGFFPAKYFGKAGPVCQSCVTNEPQCIPTHATVEITRSPEPARVPKFPETASVRISLDEPPHRSTPRSSKSVPVLKSFGSASLSLSVSSDDKNRRKKTKKLEKPFIKSKSSGKATKKSKGKILKRSVKPFVESKISAKACERSVGKISKRDQRLHKLVFEKGGLPDGSEVAYFGCGQKLLDGFKTPSGILCCCCNSEVSPSQFEAHAGWGSRRKPYFYIYTSNGVSLHELALSLSRGRKYSSKDNDSLCTICLDGGNLLLCDGCPRAFHKECASLPSVPHGDWYCIYCQNMFQSQRFVECNANAVAAGRMSGVDPIEQITRRSIRIVRDIAADISGCSLCKAHDFCKTGFGPRTVILCDQCEKEYHVGCLRSKKMADLKEIPKGDWFCSIDCTRINSTLQKLVACGAERLPRSILDIVRNKFTEKGEDNPDDLNVTWRVLCGKVTSPETRMLLSEAIAIFHASFDPIIDLLTGKDLIPSMVYGRNTKGHELRGMYCAVLMVNSHVESAAVFRVFGQEVAELPLVATRKGNHGKGYFQVLYSSIENLLASLKVSNIVLPAAEEAESIWADKFGFAKMKPDQLSSYRKCWRQMLIFQGTAMLQKAVPESRITQTAECIEEPIMVGGLEEI